MRCCRIFSAGAHNLMEKIVNVYLYPKSVYIFCIDLAWLATLLKLQEKLVKISLILF